MNSLENNSADSRTAPSRPNGDIMMSGPRCSNCQMALPSGARFCLNCGHPVGARTPTDEAHLIHLAAAAPPPLVEKVHAAAYLTGERRLVTAVFVDVVGSTTLSAQLGSAGWSAIIDKMCDWFCPVIYRYEGTIARFVGDELLAFFGAPVAHEDDPVRAVHAALDLLNTASQGAANIRQEYGVDFQVRISLSTGPVTIGPVSSNLQFEYSALEGPLNLLAQLEATKRSMAVLISEETYRLVAPFFTHIDLGAMTIQGQREPIHIYRVTGAKADSDRSRGLAGLKSPMVGRDSELKTLLQLTEAVTAGLGRAVLIAGESGLGKTRLIAEWKVRITSQTKPQWYEGHCLSYKQVMAYHLLRDLLRSLIGVSTAASEPETRAALRALSIELFGDSALDVYPYLGHLLSLTLEDEALARIRPLDPPALQAQYLAACRRLLVGLAARGPLILLLEDLQWADPSSIAILSQLLPLASHVPLLFCLVTRPHRDTPGWKLISTSRETLGGRFTELRLQTLTETESQQIISNLLQADYLPEKMRQLIQKKAEGNPFFIEEVLRMMIEQGVIHRQNGGWSVAKEISAIGIPDTLHGLLLARLDRLPDDARQTLRVAAVIGRRFSVRVLEQVLTHRPVPYHTRRRGDIPVVGQDMPRGQALPGDGQGGMALINHLGTLETSGLIDVFQVKPELIYRFRSSLLQDAVYASLLTADRQRLHLAVGAAMESLYPDQMEGIAPQIAHHFLVGGDNARAIKYLSIAGDTALNAYANQEAESRYRQALALVPSISEQADLTSKLGQALYWQGRFQDALQVWREGIGRFQELAGSDGMARLYALSARAAWSAGDTPGGLKLCQEGLAAIRTQPLTSPGPAEEADVPESAGVALLLHEAARAYLFNGLPDEARQLGQQALAMAERLGDVTVQAEALATLGLLPDQPPEAKLSTLSQAVELAESAGLLSQAARAHINLAALMATAIPDLNAARDHYRRAAELQRLRGNTAGELRGLGGMAGVLVESGNFVELEAALPAMHQLLGELSSPGPEAFHIRINEALLRRFQGDLATAAQMLSELQHEERQRGNLQNLLDIDISLAEIILASHALPDQDGIGEWSAGEAALAEAIEISDRWSRPGIRPRCLLSMIDTYRGQFSDARRHLSAAHERVGPHPPAPDQGWPSLAEARLAAAEARWAQALEHFENAAGTFARLGMNWQHARVLLDWAEAYSSRREPTDLEQARMLLQEAASSFARMGVSYYTNLARDRLRTLELESYAQALAHQRIDREMAAAGKIQVGLLPAKPPPIPGWQLAAALEPSRQTSGDFYDFIPLPEGRWGIVIADVADKGAAAALFMAVSSSLIRTYAARFSDQPEQVLAETNRRILADTHTDLFVTVFYAVLDPAAGTLLYSNAGHNPPYLFLAGGNSVHALTQTGIPVGILEDAAWGMGSVQIAPGDVLLFYTDGVTEAENEQKTSFGTDRLLETVQSNLGRPAMEIQKAILTAVDAFTGGAPPFDDITLVILSRERDV